MDLSKFNNDEFCKMVKNKIREGNVLIESSADYEKAVQLFNTDESFRQMRMEANIRHLSVIDCLLSKEELYQEIIGLRKEVQKLRDQLNKVPVTYTEISPGIDRADFQI